MTDTTIFDDLETRLDEPPLFFVEQPDVRKDLSEIQRVEMFRKIMREKAPHLILYPNANAGKRNPLQAKREGIVAGVFDYTVAWDIAHSTIDTPATVSWIEFKGYDASGRAGKLSQAQIDWGNRMHRAGYRVACFFSAKSAVRWLREQGAPIP